MQRDNDYTEDAFDTLKRSLLFQHSNRLLHGAAHGCGAQQVKARGCRPAVLILRIPDQAARFGEIEVAYLPAAQVVNGQVAALTGHEAPEVHHQAGIERIGKSSQRKVGRGGRPPVQ